MKTIVAIFITFLLSIEPVLGADAWQPQAELEKAINPNENLLISDEIEQPFIINYYKGAPGCYIACLGHSEGLYKIGSRFNMHGLIRINGAYRSDLPTNDQSDRICYPQGIEDNNSVQTYYKNLCNQYFPHCNNGCWGSNDTGGFFTRSPHYQEKK